MQPHASHLPPLTSKRVKRLRRDVIASHAALSTYPAYPHLRLSTGTESPFYGLSKTYAIQNTPFSSLKMVVFFHLSIQKGTDHTLFSCLAEINYFHLRHLQPFMFTYTPTRNPHLHTYPPFKGGKCEWWGGGTS
jgi:hypothetical protein